MARDADGDELDRATRDGLADLKRLHISRWGRIPHLATDPTSPPDGSVWLRSDINQVRYRANGTTVGSVVALTDAAQTITTSSVTDITWGTEVVDPDGWVSGGSGTLTVPAGKGGRYIVSYTGTWSASPTAIIFGAINGTALYASPAADAVVFISTLTFMRTFAAADTLIIRAFQTSGSNKDVVSRLEIASLQ